MYKVWSHQAYHEISSKYKRTVLGSIWIAGAMVSTALALAIVLGGINGQPLPDVLPYVMAGIMCFGLTGYVMADAPEVYMASSNIIKNHAYPFTYYTFESLTRVFLVFLHNLVAYYITLALLGKLVFPHWSGLLAIPLIYVNAAVWGSMASMLSARFRDLRFLLPFLAQIVFFMTPVFWRPDHLKGWRTALYQYNPFYGLMEIIRSPLLGYPAPILAWQLAGISLVVGLFLWFFCFSAFRGRIAFWV